MLSAAISPLATSYTATLWSSSSPTEAKRDPSPLKETDTCTDRGGDRVREIKNRGTGRGGWDEDGL